MGVPRPRHAKNHYEKYTSKAKKTLKKNTFILKEEITTNSPQIQPGGWSGGWVSRPTIEEITSLNDYDYIDSYVDSSFEVQNSLNLDTSDSEPKTQKETALEKLVNKIKKSL